ncbi:MAG: TolC family protein [Saprospiraceae bacterium]|nr:TolC family protein [Saprospiraceae bacterium]
MRTSQLRTYLLLIISFSLFQVDLLGQRQLSLQDAIARGLDNNHNIKISEKQIEIAENSNSWARAGKYPTITADVNWNNNLTRENNQASFLRGEFYVGSLSPGINMNWVLYNGGLTGATKESLIANVDLQRQLSSTTVQQTIQSIHQAYYDVLLQESRYNTLIETLELSADRVNYEEARKEFGSSNTFSLIQFEDAYLADSSQLIIQGNIVQAARRNLVRVMNDDVTPEYYELVDELAIPDATIDVAELEDQLLASNPDLQVLDVNARIAAINTKIERTFNKPTIALNAGLNGSYTAFKIFADDPNTGEPFETRTGDTYRLTANVSASYPLYDGGLRKDNIQNARLQQEITQTEILEATANLKNQLNILIDNFNNQLEQLRLLDRQLDNAVRNLTISEERLKTGQINSLDYRTIQNAYTNVSFNRVNTIFNLLSIRTDIAYLVGAYGS